MIIQGKYLNINKKFSDKNFPKGKVKFSVLLDEISYKRYQLHFELI